MAPRRHDTLALVSDEEREFALAWQRGDAAAGEQLFNRYYKRIARYFRNKVGAQSVDLTQKTFLACVQALPRYRGDGSFGSFLFAIAYRQLCSHYTQMRREAIDFGTVSVIDLDPSPSRMIVAREEEAVLVLALRSLPLEMQTIIELVYWERARAKDIAEIFDVPLGTAKTRVRRARQLLLDAIATQADTQALRDRTVEGLETWADNLRHAKAEDEP